MKTTSIFNKKLLYYALAILALVIFYIIFSDWENFKAGLTGNPPVF
ncbi:hypothetical protein LB450_03390 [Psychroflexus sp. CAK1W]|nr:hypothetical protein [Psychroflexus curvus]MBZ9627139.1 hypothetical protein [Psychroflexus curvus]